MTTLGYDAAGHRTSLTDGDRGNLTFTPDSLGEVTSETNAKDQTITFTYDALGRLVIRSFPAASSGTETQSWSYYPNGSGAGQLETQSDAYPGYSFSRTLTYDGNGQLATQTDTLNGSSKAMGYAHDTLGRLASVTYPVSVGGAPLGIRGQSPLIED